MNQAFLISNIDAITLELFFFSLSTSICRSEERRVSAMRSDRRTTITPTISSSEAEGHWGKSKRKHFTCDFIVKEAFRDAFFCDGTFLIRHRFKARDTNLADFSLRKEVFLRRIFVLYWVFFENLLYSRRENKISPIGTKFFELLLKMKFLGFFSDDEVEYHAEVILNSLTDH